MSKTKGKKMKESINTGSESEIEVANTYFSKTIDQFRRTYLLLGSEVFGSLGKEISLGYVDNLITNFLEVFGELSVLYKEKGFYVLPTIKTNVYPKGEIGTAIGLEKLVKPNLRVNISHGNFETFHSTNNMLRENSILGFELCFYEDRDRDEFPSCTGRGFARYINQSIILSLRLDEEFLKTQLNNMSREDITKVYSKSSNQLYDFGFPGGMTDTEGHPQNRG